MDAFSDRGSTPLASTNTILHKTLLLCRRVCRHSLACVISGEKPGSFAPWLFHYKLCLRKRYSGYAVPFLLFTGFAPFVVFHFIKGKLEIFCCSHAGFLSHIFPRCYLLRLICSFYLLASSSFFRVKAQLFAYGIGCERTAFSRSFSNVICVRWLLYTAQYVFSCSALSLADT